MSSPSLRVVVPHARSLGERYQFIRELGRGAMGIVYLARDRTTGTLVAVKVLDVRHATHDDAMRRFLREARTAASLEHPRIVRTLAIEPLDNGGVAIVSQYVPGETLRALIQRVGPLSFDRAAALLRDVAAALAHAHRARIVHRDVKPENIFVSDEGGRALLADFGIARPLDGDSLITEGDIAVGTPSYMAPEQISGLTIDERADVYALGLVGWELLAGARPWSGETLYSVLHKQQHESLPSLATLRPHVPAYLLAAIEGALWKARDRRWRDGGVLLTKLTPRPATLPDAHRAGVSGPSVTSGEAEAKTCELRRTTVHVPPQSPPHQDLRKATHSRPGWRLTPRTARILAGSLTVLLPVLAVATPIVRRARESTGVAHAASARLPTAVEPPRLAPVYVKQLSSATTAPAVSERGDTTAGSVTGQRTLVAAPPDTLTRTSPPAPTIEPARTPTRGAARTPTRRARLGRPRPGERRVPPALDPRCRSTRGGDQAGCLRGHVAQGDAAMDRTYRHILVALQRRAKGRSEPPAVRSLQREQRSWLDRRDATCRRAVRADGRPLWGLERAPCYARLARLREADLRARYRVAR